MPRAPVDADSPSAVPIVVPAVVIPVVMPLVPISVVMASVVIWVIPPTVIISRSLRRNKAGNTQHHSKQ